MPLFFSSVMKIKSFLLDIVYTKRCKYCRRVIGREKDLCSDCESNLPFITGKLCNKCGLSKENCNCTSDIRYYKAVYAPFSYEGAIKKFFSEFKFQGGEYLSEIIAQDMAEVYNKHIVEYDIDMCVFVPAHPVDKRRRGYNQSELLAKHLCSIIGLECEDALVKTRRTASQHELNRYMRSGNLVGAIELRKTADVKDKRVLLIDDIKTTGSTLNECTKMLLLGGAADVFCLVGAIKK